MAAIEDLERRRIHVRRICLVIQSNAWKYLCNITSSINKLTSL